jgi:acetylornithine/succinyldiaminopimelate/putrescine aminotransferase
MTAHPFQSATTLPSGATVIRFEGVKPQRTQRAYPFLVGHVSTYPWKYDATLREQVPTTEAVFVLTKGTSKIEVARKAAREYEGRYTEPSVILRKTATGYEVL